MKQLRAFVIGLVACSITLGMTSTATAQTTKDGIAKVVYMKGNARYMTKGSTTWQPLKTGAVLAPGTVIQTAVGSYVDLVLNNPAATLASGAGPTAVMNYQPRAEQDAVRVFESTMLGIDKLTVTQTGVDTVTETQLDLQAGRIFGTVKKMSAASRYEVKIPNGVAGIRGTIYFISADGVISVLSGSVVVAYVGPDGTPITQVVDAGQQFDARTGQITPIPDAIMESLWSMSRELRVGVFTVPAAFTVDHTLYYVSPTAAVSGGNATRQSSGAGLVSSIMIGGFTSAN